MMATVLAAENVTEAEFYEREKPYIEKYLYACAYEEKLDHDFYAAHDGEDGASFKAYTKDTQGKRRTERKISRQNHCVKKYTIIGSEFIETGSRHFLIY